MNYSEKWGKDVDEAVQLALAELKVSEDEVDIEVLEEPTKGFLGIGSQPAKVRVSLKGTEEEEKNEEKPEDEDFISYGVKDLRSHKTKESSENGESQSAQERKGYGDKKRRSLGKRNYNKEDLIQPEEIESIIANKPEDLEPLEEHEVLDFIRNTIENMGLDLSVSAEGNEDTIYVSISGEAAGVVIGKRGQTLDAIQYLASLVINKDKDHYVRVVVDAENYRSRREKTLQQLAVRLGNKAIKTGRRVKLEPMNPYERMVIHATLHKSEKVKTRSEGEEPYRRVIIEKQQ